MYIGSMILDWYMILDKKINNVKIRFNMWLQNSTYNDLKQIALFEGRSVSDIIRVLANEYILKKKLERKSLDS